MYTGTTGVHVLIEQEYTEVVIMAKTSILVSITVEKKRKGRVINRILGKHMVDI